MKRREALQSAAILMGAGLSAGTISAILGGCNPGSGSGSGHDAAPFMSEDQLSLVAEMAERILPATDTPGAKDVMVHQFIDRQVSLNASEEEKDMFLQGLESTEEKSQEIAGASFLEINDEQRDEVLQAMVNDWQNAPDNHPFFPAFRGLVVTGYFTSERVCKEVLVYDPIPGEFNGCIDYSEVGGLWAI